MPFRISTKNVLQFTLRQRTVVSVSEKEIERKIFERHDLFTRGEETAYMNSSTVPMTQPKANGNVSSFDYVIKETVNVAPVQPLSYGCTREVAKHSRS